MTVKFSDLNAQGRCNVLTVERIAQERYNQGYGYQVYCECCTRDELADEFGGFKTAAEAVNWLQSMADVHNEQYAGAWADADRPGGEV